MRKNKRPSKEPWETPQWINFRSDFDWLLDIKVLSVIKIKVNQIISHTPDTIVTELYQKNFIWHCIESFSWIDKRWSCVTRFINVIVKGSDNIQHCMRCRNIILKTTLIFVDYIVFFEGFVESCLQNWFNHFSKTSEYRNGPERLSANSE